MISVCEYQFLPNNSANRKPYTYLVLLLILIGIYAVRAVYSAIKSKRGDRQPFQKIRHQAPLFAAFFLLLAIYDYLTLKNRHPDPAVRSLLKQHHQHRLGGPQYHPRQHSAHPAPAVLRLLHWYLGRIGHRYCLRLQQAHPQLGGPNHQILRSYPDLHLIPIIMVVCSSLFKGAIFIIALGSWFAVTVASMTGISNVDKEYFEAARTLGATERQLVFKVAIPHAMPSILQGMTQAMSSACTAIMIAEMMGVKAGLGWYMNWAKSWAAYDKMFAALFVICFIFTIVTKTLALIKKRVLRWQIGVVK